MKAPAELWKKCWTPSAQDLINEARTWLNTPFRHQASVKGIGCDCLGFLKGVARETGAVPRETLDAIPSDYGREPEAAAIRAFALQWLDEVPVSEMVPGDIVFFAIDGHVRHIGMLTDYGIIHCLPNALGVREHRLDSRMRAQIRWAFRFPGLADVG